ncbi:formyltransferase family protein [Plesiomonas shigelloides]|uniref:formyltransferase family protein n=1 Tax=Plesiomonas shigelloides TaxID=703 RepID=UPI002248230A|nr:formyltransferase family protein [Plesiomonas shigelloides]MCX2497455.1 formyltransferase family protein [Plesiomonas shigelloides]
MHVAIICSDKNHPIYPHLIEWCNRNRLKHVTSLFTSVKEITQGGDILFLISCSEIVRDTVRNAFRYTLVLHASDLPRGRGWSPHIWDIINGSSELTLSLLNADDRVDTGDIWKKVRIQLDGSELYDEINKKLFNAELMLMDWACKNIDSTQPQKQSDTLVNYYKKRTSIDSEIDIEKSIKSQFNLLRVCDPDRYPAYFIINNQKYKIKLEKMHD